MLKKHHVFHARVMKLGNTAIARSLEQMCTIRPIFRDYLKNRNLSSVLGKYRLQECKHFGILPKHPVWLQAV